MVSDIISMESLWISLSHNTKESSNTWYNKSLKYPWFSIQLPLINYYNQIILHFNLNDPNSTLGHNPVLEDLAKSTAMEPEQKIPWLHPQHNNGEKISLNTIVVLLGISFSMYFDWMLCMQYYILISLHCIVVDVQLDRYILEPDLLFFHFP